MNKTATYQFADRVNTVPMSFIREILKTASQPGIISFAGGLPNPELFPVSQLAKAAADVFMSDGANALQYSTTEGYYPLRQFISERYLRQQGMYIPPENILITNGSQQALDLIGKVFINPGDNVLIERPSYLGAIQCLSMFEPVFSEIDLEEDGINTEKLWDACWSRNIKMFYCVPNFHNPTGITYSMEKREAIADHFSRFSPHTIIVEDDPYGEICFGEKTPASIKSFNNEQTILLGSFSKIVAPGMRMGWLAAPAEIMEKINKMKQASDLHSNFLSQRILHRYLSDNDLDEHIGRIKAQYKAQKNLMVALLKRYTPFQVKFTEPEGGMFLWLTLPSDISARAVLNDAVKEGIMFVPGDSFYQKNDCWNTIRLNFTSNSAEKMEEGIRKLGAILHRHIF